MLTSMSLSEDANDVPRSVETADESAVGSVFLFSGSSDSRLGLPYLGAFAEKTPCRPST
jgi:hypothetical protein